MNNKLINNAVLQERKEAAIARGQGNLAAVYIKKAINAELWDVEGKRYIDFAAGIAVVNTGHSHPKIKAAAIRQIEDFSHSCVMVTPYQSAIDLAEQLNKCSPIAEAKALLVTTGAEAVENTIKIARAYTGQSAVIAFSGGFHGRTNLCMGLTGKVAPYKQGFGPFPNDIYHIPFPIEYHGITMQDSLQALENLFKVSIEAQRVAAIIIEPVQGEGGFYPAPQGFLAKLREVCDHHGILLICDEIQTGFARTGKLFATEYHQIEPDLMTMAKGMAGGFPIAAVVGKAEVMDSANSGGLGGTYGGSPVACAAALSVLEVIEEENLCQAAVEIGDIAVASLKKLQQQHPNYIGDIRNSGAMIALELVNNGDANQPNSELVKKLLEKAIINGLVLLSCGIRGNVIRLLMPLTIEKSTLAEGLEILDKSFNEALAP